MPEICRFYGIIISLFYGDHNPPHFHVRHGEFKAAIRISDFQLLEGALPPRALGLVIEWAARHQAELSSGWEMAAGGKTPARIKPLD